MRRPCGLVLAGGAARRMGGGDKPLLRLGRGTLISAVLARVAPQCESLVINTSSADARWADYPHPRVPDTITPPVGPLGGVLAGLDYFYPEAGPGGWLLTVPGDTPFLPADLVHRLDQARRESGMQIACASSRGRVQPVVALWSFDIRAQLRAALSGELRSVRRFQVETGVVEVDWPVAAVDPFCNVNTPEDLAEVERLAADQALGLMSCGS